MNLFEMVCEMASCNGMVIKPQSRWPELKPFDFDRLNIEAERIPVDKIAEFVDGETDHAMDIAREFEALHLHVFLDMVFNGDIEIAAD